MKQAVLDNGSYSSVDMTAAGMAALPENFPAPVPQEMSFAQLLIGLVSEQWITVEEGRAWRDRVGLPSAVVSAVASLPPEYQFAAETRALAPSAVLRSDPLVVLLGTMQGKTSDDLDAFFIRYSAA